MKELLIIAVAILGLCSGAVHAQENVETGKIDYLIASVENLKGAKFIRNGVEYDGKEASKHLRDKLKSAGNKVKTADDFIRICASYSYISGKPYLIRKAGGETIKAELFFREKMREYISGNK